MSNLEEFKALGLSEMMLEAVAEKGFETPSPIQAITIPKLLTQTNDIIAQAQTGTGKTAAFALPIMDRISPKGKVQAIILVPTRELALQVTEEMLSFNKQKRLSISAIYGGAAISEQLRRLSRGVDIVVATPGRCLDHIRRGTLDLSNIEYLIMDEADEMLNMGFIEDIEEIMSVSSDQRRVLLFSATMPQRIVSLSKKYMHNTEVLKVDASSMTTDLTDQIYFEVREGDKLDALTRIIDVEADFYGIVFVRTKVGVDDIVSKLIDRGYSAEGLHGDVSQASREKILKKFKNKVINILIATDVAARGIDVNNLTHVINYSLPQDSESYVHRIGRTGRAGNQGTAITFISSSEYRQFGWLKRDINVDIKKEILPTAQDVVTMKRNRIKEELIEVIGNESYSEYSEMAIELLADHAPEVAMSALLKMAFKSQLEESSYPDIRSITVDRKGTARLFISFGRLDGYDARQMADLLKKECGMTDGKLNDIKVMDSYSFVSVPYADAEICIRQLNNMRKGGRPIAELAGERKDGGGGGERRSSGRGDGREGRPPRREGGGERSSFRSKREGGDSFESRPPRAKRTEGDFERPARAKRTESSEEFAAPRAKRAPKADKESAPRTIHDHKEDLHIDTMPKNIDWDEFFKDTPAKAKIKVDSGIEGAVKKRKTVAATPKSGDWYTGVKERKAPARAKAAVKRTKK